jgi:Mn2+/Fe2+ NRAMP family transporter
MHSTSVLGQASLTVRIIQTSARAAQALRPVAGAFAETIFALGVIGTGLLSVPVLAGSAAYAVGEARKWPTGLARQPIEAKAFYAVICIATIVGIIMNFTPIDPIRALYWSAVINGVVAVPVMAIMMWLAAAPRVMGDFAITGWSQPRSWRWQSRPCSPPPDSGVSLCRSSWNPGEKKRFVRTHRRRTP